MSKVDAQRAMREAKYARLKASGPTRREEAAAAGEAPAAPATPTPASKTARPAKTVPAVVALQGELCGHKSMNGRACTREAAHSEKSHRYS